MAGCVWRGVTGEGLAEAGARARRATGPITGDGLPARYVGSILIPADEIALRLFEGASLSAAEEPGAVEPAA